MQYNITNTSEIVSNFLINKTALYIKIAILQTFKANNYDITPEQFGILYIVSLENGLYQRQLSKLTLKDRPNMTRLINVLEERGLLYREIDEDNRRISKVFITDKGKKQVEKILPSVIEVQNKALEGLTEKDLELLRKTLKKVQNNLEEIFKLQI